VNMFILCSDHPAGQNGSKITRKGYLSQ